MSNKNLPFLGIKIGVIIILQGFIVSIISQCCLQFNSNACIRCPTGMHLYRSNCIYDIDGCLQYNGGFDCSSCRANYKLTEGLCQHERFSPSISNGSNFTVFLQSSIKPDELMSKAKDTLQSYGQMWINWRNFTLLKNRTYQSKNILVKNALNLMNFTIGDHKLHYIFTSSKIVQNITLYFYRFTYAPSLIGGFVDCLVVLQATNQSQNYIELNQVRINLIANQSGWYQIQSGSSNQTYIINRLSKLFPKIVNETFIKGYLKKIEDTFNFTMFFMNNNKGVVSYIYLADIDQLPKPTNISNSSKSTNSSTVQPNQPNQTPNISKNSIKNVSNVQQSQQNKQNITKQKQTNQNTSVNVNSTSKANQTEIYVSLDNLKSDPIYEAGYAVINQQYPISGYILRAMFYMKGFPITYGFYLDNNITYCRTTFIINEAQKQLQIISYQQSILPFIDFQKKDDSRKINQTIKTNKNNTQNNSHTIKSNTNNILNTSINSFSSCNNQNTSFIDITKTQSNDIFLPKISLILKTMFQDKLINTRISSVKYMLDFTFKSISNITYQITYQNNDGKTYFFQVSIINNQFQLIKSPPQDPPTNTNNLPTPAPTISTPPQNETNDNKSNTTSNNNTSPNVHTNEVKYVQPIIHKSEKIITNQNPSNKNESIKQTPNKIIQIPKQNGNSSLNTTIKSKINNTNIKIQISSKNYTTQPKYKSLITILRSLYRIPNNATVTSMETWEDIAGGSRYQIIFNMNYSNPLPDGSQAKISTYQLIVNTNSFVSVQSQKITYSKPAVKQQNQTPKPALSLPFVSHQSIPIDNQSVFLNNLKEIFTIHSPLLRNYDIRSLNSSFLAKISGQSVTKIKQIIEYRNQNHTICFSIQFWLFQTNQTKKNNIINIKEYYLVNCSEINKQNQPIKLTSTSPDIVFVNESSATEPIKQRLLALNNNKPVIIDSIAKWNNYLRIRFTSQNTGEKQLVIDTSRQLIVSYLISPKSIFTPTLMNQKISSQIIQALQLELERIFKLSPMKSDIHIIRKINDHQYLWYLQILGRVKIQTNWIQPIYRNFKLIAVFYPNQAIIKIVNAQQTHLFQYEYHLDPSKANLTRISPIQTLDNQKFRQIIQSLRNSYTNFFQNSYLVGAFVPINLETNQSFTNYLLRAKGSSILIQMGKSFTRNYNSFYHLWVNYHDNKTEIQSIEVLANNYRLKVNHCIQDYQQSTKNIPICKKCDIQHAISYGTCIDAIKGCKEYYQNVCIECESGYLNSQDMRSCVSLQQNINKIRKAISNLYSAPKF